MPNARFRFIPFLLLCAACEQRAPAPVAKPEPPADPADPKTRVCFAGDVILAGALARETTGAIVLFVRAVASQQPLLQRSYEAEDPWRSRNAIAFGLTAADKVVETLPAFGREMELVARFDSDGNPATREDADVEVVTRARTGATDILIVLARNEADLARAAQVDGK